MNRLIAIGTQFCALNSVAQMTAKVVEVRDGDSFHGHGLVLLLFRCTFFYL